MCPRAWRHTDAFILSLISKISKVAVVNMPSFEVGLRRRSPLYSKKFLFPFVVPYSVHLEYSVLEPVVVALEVLPKLGAEGTAFNGAGLVGTQP